MKITISFEISDDERLSLAQSRYGEDKPLSKRRVGNWARLLIEGELGALPSNQSDIADDEE